MKVFIIFPKDSEALFNKKSTRTFGGASVQLYNIAKELSNYKNIKIYSIIPDYKQIEFDDYEQFNLIKVYKEGDSNLVKLFKFTKYCITLKPDIIIQRGLTTESCILAFFCWVVRIKFIFMFAHDVEVLGLRQSDSSRVWLFGLLLNFAYKLIVQNIYQKQVLLEKFKKESQIFYNSFEIKHQNKKKLNKKKEILWIARCDKWKQPELFIDLANRNNKMHFIMICPPNRDLDYYTQIKQKAMKLSNCEFIEFVPYERVWEYFQHAYLFVNTSVHEGFPHTFIQAFMCSVPVLSLCVNPDDILMKYNCGIYCNGDFEFLNLQLNKLLNDREYYNKLSTNAANYVQKYHDIKKNLHKLIYLLNGDIYI